MPRTTANYGGDPAKIFMRKEERKEQLPTAKLFEPKRDITAEKARELFAKMKEVCDEHGIS